MSLRPAAFCFALVLCVVQAFAGKAYAGDSLGSLFENALMTGVLAVSYDTCVEQGYLDNAAIPAAEKYKNYIDNTPIAENEFPKDITPDKIRDALRMGLQTAQGKVAAIKPKLDAKSCKRVDEAWQQISKTFDIAAAQNDEKEKSADTFKEYGEAAEQGDATAQYKLGGLYFKGSGVKQDYAMAMKWSRMAADQGNEKAQFNVGLMYYIGLGVPKDTAEAATWFQKSADQGDVQARNVLAEIKAKNAQP